MSFSTDDFAKALEQHDYQFRKGQTVRGKAYSYESDGVYVDIGGKSAAFLPMEEASLEGIRDLSIVLPPDLEREFLIVREQDENGQVTLSIRALEAKKIWQQLLEVLENDQTLNAVVTGTNKGGVTIKVQGLRGFIPRSHLVERNNLEALVGRSLTVSLLEVNPDQNKLVASHRLAAQAASLRQLVVGQVVDGKVVGIKPFGAFIEFDGTTGLLHINQISKNYVASLPALLEVGQPIKAVIVELDEIKRRISLSTKVLENYPGEVLENMEAVMAEAETRAEKASKAIAQES